MPFSFYLLFLAKARERRRRKEKFHEECSDIYQLPATSTIRVLTCKKIKREARLIKKEKQKIYYNNVILYVYNSSPKPQ